MQFQQHTYGLNADESETYSPIESFTDFFDNREEQSNLIQESSSTESSPSSSEGLAPFSHADSGSLFGKSGAKAVLDDSTPWFHNNDVFFASSDAFDENQIDFASEAWQTTTEQGMNAVNFNDYFTDPNAQAGDSVVDPAIIRGTRVDESLAHPTTSATMQSPDSNTDHITPIVFKSESPMPDLQPTAISKPQHKRRKSTRQQEEVALDKQRERNRLAAGRCRKKQIERSQKLTDKASRLEKDRAELHLTVAVLHAEVLSLKEELLRHNDCGNAQIRDYLQWRVNALLAQPRRGSDTHTQTLTQTQPETQMDMESMMIDAELPEQHAGTEAVSSPQPQS